VDSVLDFESGDSKFVSHCSQCQEIKWCIFKKSSLKLTNCKNKKQFNDIEKSQLTAQYFSGNSQNCATPSKTLSPLN